MRCTLAIWVDTATCMNHKGVDGCGLIILEVPDDERTAVVVSDNQILSNFIDVDVAG